MEIKQKSSKFSLSGLKSLVYEEELPTASTPNPVAAPLIVDTAEYAPQIDPKIKESLKAALQENALGSYDYLKFRKSADELKSDIADEKSRFKAAFVAAKTMNITKEKLIETANHYLTVLSEEQRKFKEAIEGTNKDKIVTATTRVSEIKASIAEKNAMIQNLRESVTALQGESDTLQTKITEDKRKIEVATSGFNSTYDLFVQEIKNDIGKMQSIL